MVIWKIRMTVESRDRHAKTNGIINTSSKLYVSACEKFSGDIGFIETINLVIFI